MRQARADTRYFIVNGTCRSSAHLLWIDNEHADDHSVSLPKIGARLLDLEKDGAMVDELSEDGRGPRALLGPVLDRLATRPPRGARPIRPPFGSRHTNFAAEDKVATRARPASAGGKRRSAGPSASYPAGNRQSVQAIAGSPRCGRRSVGASADYPWGNGDSLGRDVSNPVREPRGRYRFAGRRTSSRSPLQLTRARQPPEG